MKRNFKELTPEELSAFILKMGQKPYRAKQILRWIYKGLASSFEEMTDLPKEFREQIHGSAFISGLRILNRQISRDGTQKFLFELDDGETVESVLIPNTRGADKYTLCISSQVGCALKCAFCATGALGLKRNLRAFEIVDQVISVKRTLLKDTAKDQSAITNIVFMGMGEPLNNLKEVAEAIGRITGLMEFSKRRITVSTAGVVPGILELAKKAPGVNLAVSLNATTDDIRSRIMPVNRKYPLRTLIEACRRYPLSPRKRITFEYVLLDGVNNTEQDAVRLIKLLRGVRAKVNLIPYNPHTPDSFGRPSDGSTLEFQNLLLRSGLHAIIRKSMGGDISAACGQLKALYKPK